MTTEQREALDNAADSLLVYVDNVFLFIKVIHSMMLSRARCITDKVFQRLRHIYHELKNIVAEIRLGGQTLLHFDSSEVDWLSRMIEIIKDFNDLIDENSQLKNLYDSTIEGFSS